MVTWLALAVVLQNQGKEIGFLELEELKWKATKDVRNGAGEWTLVVPAEGEGTVTAKVTYRVVDDRNYMSWTVEDQRFELFASDDEGVVVDHKERSFFKLDVNLVSALFGVKEGEPKNEKYEPEKVEEGTMKFAVAQFQSVLMMNPVPKWASTTSTKINGRKMTLVTHRLVRDDGSLRGEVKQWFPEGTWITERATVRTVDEEGKETFAEINAKVLDLSGRLKKQDVGIPPSAYEGYTDSLGEDQAQALLMMLFALKGR